MTENCDFEQSIYKECQSRLYKIDWRGIWKYKLLNHRHANSVLSHLGTSIFVFNLLSANPTIADELFECV